MNTLWLSSGLFAVTLLLVIWQPKGLKIGTTAVTAAILTLCCL
jgi:arsenical pump membrane protein